MIPILTTERVAEIAALASEATPGPWERSRNWSIVGAGHDWDRTWPIDEALVVGVGKGDPLRVRRADFRVCYISGPGEKNCAVADAHFIAAARTIVPELCASHERLRKDVAMLDKCHEALREMSGDLVADLRARVAELEARVAAQNEEIWAAVAVIVAYRSAGR